MKNVFNSTNAIICIGAAGLILAVWFVGFRGGDDDSSSGTAIFACLEQHYEGRVSDEPDDLDYVAQDAGDKGIHVDFERNSLNIAVERSESDAEQTLKAYRLFLTDASSDQLSREGTVVMAYDKTPRADELEPVMSCVQGS